MLWADALHTSSSSIKLNAGAILSATSLLRALRLDSTDVDDER